MIPLLIGIFIAATLFAALLLCAYQAFTTRGTLQYASVATIVLTLLAMTGITYGVATPVRILGVVLFLVGGVTLVKTPGWSRLLILSVLIFAIALILGLPFIRV